ncbi:MAG: TRAP transporter large permease subunit [Rhodobacter sp.]|nr:TRAP transporter large permease subunit [Rhodobacter sp.]
MDLLIIVSTYVAVLIFLIFFGLPIVFALGVVAVGSLYLANPALILASGQLTWDGLTSFVLGAIPMFIFMGYLLFESGLSKRIYDGIYPLLDRLLPGACCIPTSLSAPLSLHVRGRVWLAVRQLAPWRCRKWKSAAMTAASLPGLSRPAARLVS